MTDRIALKIIKRLKKSMLTRRPLVTKIPPKTLPIVNPSTELDERNV